MKKQNVFITGGGTGGHLYPAIVVGKALQEKGYRVIYIGSSCGIESKIIPADTDFEFIRIKASGLGGSILNKVLAFLFLFINVLKLFFLILVYNPIFIIGTGGYVSAPVIIAGSFLGKTAFLLEQNYLPGKTTRFLSYFSKKIFVSFPETVKFIKKSVFTGNPIREEIFKYGKEEARLKLGFDKDTFTILVTGASQGAKNINEAVIAALKTWKDKPWQIIHLTGEKNYTDVEKRTREITSGIKLKYKPLPYLEDIHLAYAGADLVISRSGATTIAELNARGLPAVLVPYPHAAENHQHYNARYQEENGAGIIIEDKNVINELAGMVENLALDKDKLTRMSKNSLKLSTPDALGNILKEIVENL